MQLSIVIPTLNEADHLPALLDRLQAARGERCELIVVDGGSRDGTPNLAQAAADRVIDSPPGRARQMNAGARVARGRQLWFVHADARVGPEHAAAIPAQAPWGFFRVQLLEATGVLRLVETAMNHRSALTRVATGDQGLFVDAELFKRLGGFPDLALMEDVALSKALRRCAQPIVVRSPAIGVSTRRWQARGTLRTVLLMWWLRLCWWAGVDDGRLARWYR